MFPGLGTLVNKGMYGNPNLSASVYARERQAVGKGKEERYHKGRNDACEVRDAKHSLL